MRVLILDNYDSFTFNLAQYLGELGAEPVVVRSDVVPAAEAAGWEMDRLVISPGPGRPEAAGFSIDYVKTFGSRVPTLGVCLGHQAVVVAYGGAVGAAPEPRHGKTSPIRHDQKGLFRGCDNPFTATRYHSLAVERSGLPDCLEVTAWTAGPAGEPAEIMGLRHRTYDIEGVQFHPEAVLTEHGHRMLGNFLRRVDTHVPVRAR